MKRRNWVLIILAIVGLAGFLLSRTVWGPPSKAVAAESGASPVTQEHAADETSDAQRRYISNQPRHWRYVILKRN